MPSDPLNFAREHPAIDFTSFDQGREMRQSSVVSEGICHEIVRMWIFARNFPTVLTDIKTSFTEPSKELVFLTKHLPTLMTAQDDYANPKNVSVIDGMRRFRQVHGLTEHDNMEVDTSRLLKGLWKLGRGALAHVGVRVPKGFHAIGFDLRTGFALFDPNTGLWEAKNYPKKACIKFILEYYQYCEYDNYRMCIYTKCK
jgi:hypothetical protein